jgi:hypothetical protein
MIVTRPNSAMSRRSSSSMKATIPLCTRPALTNGVRDGAWHADGWGVVFEVLFDTEEQWDAFRGLPVVRAALDAVSGSGG